MTYGKSLNILADADRTGLITKMSAKLRYIGYLYHWPVLDKWLKKKPILMWLNRRGYFNGKPLPSLTFAAEAQLERRRQREQKDLDAKSERLGHQSTEETLTDKFLSVQEAHPGSLGPSEILSLALSVIVAGSDSTAVSITEMMFYLLKTSHAYKRLRLEVDRNFPEDTEISFTRAQSLQYLSAVVKEGFRMHPAPSWAAERVVGRGGKLIDGRFVPEGTVVGVSAWVVHRDREIFGEDVEKFRPERWLVNESDSVHTKKQEAKVKEMERHLLHFGVGPYTCIGRNIALMEIYKVIPALIREFDWELENPERELRFMPGIFVNVEGCVVKIRKRHLQFMEMGRSLGRYQFFIADGKRRLFDVDQSRLENAAEEIMIVGFNQPFMVSKFSERG